MPVGEGAEKPESDIPAAHIGFFGFSFEFLMNLGMLYAAAAYAAWGLFPIYFRSLQDIPPTEILTHRMLWSLAFVLIVLVFRKQWSWLPQVMRRPRVLAGFTASALLLAGNWLLYIWAVNSDHVVESSLGYFINPLFNVMLGALVLGERLRPAQWAAVILAACGVMWLTWHGGRLPWIALLLAASFGLYGLLRKTASLGPLEGLALETMVLCPLAACYMTYLLWQGQSHFGTVSASSRILLAISGPLTAIPLLLFAAGARRITLSVLGLLQYIGPTLQLILAIWLYHEPFDMVRLAGFSVIWSALAIFSLEGLWRTMKMKARPADR